VCHMPEGRARGDMPVLTRVGECAWGYGKGLHACKSACAWDKPVPLPPHDRHRHQAILTCSIVRYAGVPWYLCKYCACE
jgi:hypothetical protein